MKILLLSVTAGYGHHATAKALADLFEQRGAEVEIVDVQGAFRAEKVEGAKVTAFNDNGSAVLEMKNGAAQAAPVDCKGVDPCKYCRMKPICRIIKTKGNEEEDENS